MADAFELPQLFIDLLLGVENDQPHGEKDGAVGEDAQSDTVDPPQPFKLKDDESTSSSLQFPPRTDSVEEKSSDATNDALEATDFDASEISTDTPDGFFSGVKRKNESDDVPTKKEKLEHQVESSSSDEPQVNDPVDPEQLLPTPEEDSENTGEEVSENTGEEFSENTGEEVSENTGDDDSDIYFKNIEEEDFDEEEDLNDEEVEGEYKEEYQEEEEEDADDASVLIDDRLSTIEEVTENTSDLTEVTLPNEPSTDSDENIAVLPDDSIPVVNVSQTPIEGRTDVSPVVTETPEGKTSEESSTGIEISSFDEIQVVIITGDKDSGGSSITDSSSVLESDVKTSDEKNYDADEEQESKTSEESDPTSEASASSESGEYVVNEFEGSEEDLTVNGNQQTSESEEKSETTPNPNTSPSEPGSMSDKIDTDDNPEDGNPEEEKVVEQVERQQNLETENVAAEKIDQQAENKTEEQNNQKAESPDEQKVVEKVEENPEELENLDTRNVATENVNQQQQDNPEDDNSDEVKQPIVQMVEQQESQEDESEEYENQEDNPNQVAMIEQQNEEAGKLAKWWLEKKQDEPEEDNSDVVDQPNVQMTEQHESQEDNHKQATMIEQQNVKAGNSNKQMKRWWLDEKEQPAESEQPAETEKPAELEQPAEPVQDEAQVNILGDGQTNAGAGNLDDGQVDPPNQNQQQQPAAPVQDEVHLSILGDGQQNAGAGNLDDGQVDPPNQNQQQQPPVPAQPGTSTNKPSWNQRPMKQEKKALHSNKKRKAERSKKRRKQEQAIQDGKIN